MDKKFKLQGSITTKQVAEDTIIIEGYASTTSQDRHGDVILSEAWEGNGLENFKKNSIILYNHNHSTPIGMAEDVWVDEKGLGIKAKIVKAVAGNIFDAIKEGIVKAFSVGFMVIEADFEENLGKYGGFIIKKAELLEVSAVSVPANQDAIFSIAKSFDSEQELERFKREVASNKNSVAPGLHSSPDSKGLRNEKYAQSISKDKKMFDDEQLEQIVQNAVAQASKKTAEEVAASMKAEAERKAAEEAEAQRKAQEVETQTKTVVEAAVSGAEKLIEDLKKELENKDKDFAETIESLKSDIAAKSEEIVKIRENKVYFDERGNNKGDWKEAFKSQIDDVAVLALASKNSLDAWNQTELGRDLMEKVNEHSGVQVSTEDFEQVVSTNVERDIQLELVLYPLFREVQMNAATMIFPVLPDAGYAEFTTAPTAGGSSPHGNLASRGDSYGSPYGGNDLTERTVSTKKLMSQSFLGNETEEDAIMPILPLIRESMVRSHARSLEAMILAGNHGDGPFGTGNASPDGLIKIADDDGNQSNAGASGFASSDKITAANLLTIRRNMGKYAVKPSDLIYVVSLDVYYDLLEDPEFQDVNLVGDMATKVTGQVGSIYGSKVIISDEFATKAAGKFCAIGVNTRNYFIPRLRGFTVESDYEVRYQRRVAVMTQRLGFTDIIDGAKSVWGFQYKLT